MMRMKEDIKKRINKIPDGSHVKLDIFDEQKKVHKPLITINKETAFVFIDNSREIKCYNNDIFDLVILSGIEKNMLYNMMYLTE